MVYDYKEKKIVAVINKDLSVGLAMNALGHMAFAIGSYSDNLMMGAHKYIDASGNSYNGISKYPFMVLQATQEQIEQIAKKSDEKDVTTVKYTQEMFDTDTDDELKEAIMNNSKPVIHAIVVSGDKKPVNSLTGSFGLYR